MIRRNTIKLISLLVAACLLCSVFALSVFAEGEDDVTTVEEVTETTTLSEETETTADETETTTAGEEETTTSTETTPVETTGDDTTTPTEKKG